MPDSAAIIVALGGLLTAVSTALVVLLREVRRLRALRHHRHERPSEPGTRRRILLVDDDDDGAALFARMLRPLNVQVIRAASAEEALDLMAREGFALMVVDVRLPGLSGPDLVHRLRPRVLLMSGLPEDELAEKARGAGVQWLRKTGDVQALREAIARMLG